MKKQEPMRWEPGPLFPFKPEAIFECPCYRCGFVTRTPHRYVDDAEANYWRSRYEKLLASLNDAVEQCNKWHGDDPISAMHRDFKAQLIAIRDKLKEKP